MTITEGHYVLLAPLLEHLEQGRNMGGISDWDAAREEAYQDVWEFVNALVYTKNETVRIYQQEDPCQKI